MKGFFRVAFFFEPAQSQIGDDVGYVAGNGSISFLGNEGGVNVIPLARQDHEFVHSFGVIAEVELTEHSGLITSLLKYLRESNLSRIKRKVIVDLTIDVSVLSSEDGRPGRRTNGIGHTGIGKQNPFFGNAINIGGFNQMIAIGANCLISVIIGHDEKNVWFFPACFPTREKDQAGKT